MPRRTDELLYDSQATLRLLDHELSELRDPFAPQPAPAAAVAHAAAPHGATCRCGAAPAAPGGLLALPGVLERASQEIAAVLNSLRESRNALALASVERLQHTHEKLREVSSATEVAATDILDALDRAGQIVDALDAEDGAPEAAAAERQGPALRARLRDEIFGMMGALQFQDITTQQLNYASSVLVEMEARLAQVAQLFEPAAALLTVTSPSAARTVDPGSFDPNATTRDAETRQALADEIFTGPAAT
jgi:chemotaxis regulatin CheY-phosphate phosphatase CheZ